MKKSQAANKYKLKNQSKMELNNFALYLRNYLRDHSFDNKDLEADIVKLNADNATQTFVNERKAGNSVHGATEVA